jgi:hypothetical protein
MMFHLLPAWRKEGAAQYAHPVASLTEAEWERTRYAALNRTAFSEHGTYEFRLHHGSLDGAGLSNWANLLLHFVEAYRALDLTEDQARRMAQGAKRPLLARFCKDTNLPLYLRKFVFKRSAEYWTKRCGLFTKREGIAEIPPPLAAVPAPPPLAALPSVPQPTFSTAATLDSVFAAHITNIDTFISNYGTLRPRRSRPIRLRGDTRV